MTGTAPVTGFPLTSQQARVWAASRLGGVPSWHGYVADLPAGLDVARLAAAVDVLVDRHPALRTRIERIDGRLVQLDDAPRAAVESVVEPAAGQPLPEIAARVAIDRGTAMDPRVGPGIRFVVAGGGGAERVLVVLIDGVIADGWSRLTVLGELDQLVADPATELPAPGTPPGELAVRQAAWCAGEDHAQRLEFWRHRLVSGAPMSGGTGRREARWCVRPLPARTVELVTTRCAAARVSPAAGYLGALVDAVGVAPDTAEVPVFLVTSGRGAAVGSTVGVFANQLPTPIPRAAGLSGTWAAMVAALRNDLPLSCLLAGLPAERATLAHATRGGITFQVAPRWPATRLLRWAPLIVPGSVAVPLTAIEVSVRASPEVGVHAVWDAGRCADDDARQLVDRMVERLGGAD